jgi:hypothetical protein
VWRGSVERVVVHQAAPTGRVASPRLVGLPDKRCAITEVLVSSRQSWWQVRNQDSTLKTTIDRA